MPRKATPKKPKSQKRPSTDDSFEAVARRLECDEDKGRFETKLGKIAKAKAVRPKPKGTTIKGR